MKIKIVDPREDVIELTQKEYDALLDEFNRLLAIDSIDISFEEFVARKRRGLAPPGKDTGGKITKG